MKEDLAGTIESSPIAAPSESLRHVECLADSNVSIELDMFFYDSYKAAGRKNATARMTCRTSSLLVRTQCLENESKAPEMREPARFS
jgi:hypothetical protein